MNPEITDLYRQLQSFADESDTPSIKAVISGNFEFLCQVGKQKSTLLHKLMESGKFDVLREILKAFDENFQNPSLAPCCKALEATARKNFFDQPDHCGDTPLMLAARYSQPDLLVQLLENHANVNQVNRYGSTPLLEAVEEESLPMVAALLQYNANIYQTDRDGLTSSDLAIKKENPEIYSALLSHKADPEKMATADVAMPNTTEPEFARDLPQVLKTRDITAVKHYLDEIAAASKDQKVQVTPYMLKSLQDHPRALKLLIQYKNGYQRTSAPDEEEASPAEQAPGKLDGLATEITAQPCSDVQIVGMPAAMGLALTDCF